MSRPTKCKICKRKGLQLNRQKHCKSCEVNGRIAANRITKRCY